MSTKNTKKKTTKYGAASSSLPVTVNTPEGKYKKIVSINPVFKTMILLAIEVSCILKLLDND